MITTRLGGGVGNLMFQIAAAYSLAKDNNDKCLFDFTNGGFSQRKPDDFLDNILSKVDKFNILNYTNYVSYNEPEFKYNKISYNITNDNLLVLNGYFQSEKYFLNNKTDIINLFTCNNTINKLITKYNSKLKNSVSIHVRHGDYLKLQHYHPVITLNYINTAIEYIDNITEIDNIFIISDDINWCKKCIKDDRCIFITNQKDYEDLYLISLCENNIGSNSTFSWWGSYLNQNKNKIVIFPKKWFGEHANLNWKDIYFENNIIL